ncbi:hypothetical protein C806_00109 [Lachnospiraceae bacterium 3-1]|nr:hypothetical protein C806_00109 [Lachnospiraceae bacterium 3-1]
MTIGERIKKIRRQLDMTQSEFASQIKSTQNTIARYETNNRTPSSPVIALICREFNVDEEWLKYGKGGDENMFLSTSRYDEISKFTRQLLADEEDSFKNRLIAVLADLSLEEWEFLEKRLKQLFEGTYSTVDIHKNPMEAPLNPYVQNKIDAEVNEFRRELELEASQVEELSVYGNTKKNA